MTSVVGIDLVRVSRVAESLDAFGDRFLRRIFTEDEAAYATASPPLTHERLAARFAAKEAALKALGLVDRGVSWRDIEVVRLASGAVTLRLHGRAQALAAGAANIALSISHEGDFATAVVVANVVSDSNPFGVSAAASGGPQVPPNEPAP